MDKPEFGIFKNRHESSAGGWILTVEEIPTESSQPRWIEAPANYRVYAVPRYIFDTGYDLLDENGNQCPPGRLERDCFEISLIRRKADGKLFKRATWVPIEVFKITADGAEVCEYLEEA